MGKKHKDDILKSVAVVAEAGAKYAKADRAGAFERLKMSFVANAEAVKDLAFDIAAFPDWTRNADTVQDLYSAFGPVSLAFFAPFVGNLEFAEEEEVRHLMVDVEIAWENLLAAIVKRSPGLAPKVDGARQHLQELKQSWSDIFFGFAPPEFTRAWLAAIGAIHQDFDEIFGELGQ